MPLDSGAWALNKRILRKYRLPATSSAVTGNWQLRTGLGEKSHAHFELDSHRGSAGFGQRRRSTGDRLATAGAASGDRCNADSAAVAAACSRSGTAISAHGFAT